MSGEDNVAAIYGAHEDAEEAVKALHRAGYDITKLSIVYDGCRIQERILGFYSEMQRVGYWGKVGAISGSIVGLLIGVALFTGPSVTLAVVVEMLAVTFAVSVFVGGLTAAAAYAYGKVLTRDSQLKYELGAEGEDQFSLVTNKAEDVTEMRALLKPDRSSALRQSSRGNESHSLGSTFGIR